MTVSELRLMSGSMTETPNMKLASILLGQDVREWIAGRRNDGRSWRLISRDLYEATNKQVDVTHEAIRSWAVEDAA